MFFAIHFCKCSKNIFVTRIINDVCQWCCVISFFNYKIFLRLIWSVALFSFFFFFFFFFLFTIFYFVSCFFFFFFFFLYFTITNFKFRTLLLFSTSKATNVLDLTLAGFILIVLWYHYFDYSIIYAVVLFNYVIEFINVQVLWYCSHMFANLIFQGPNVFLSKKRFSFITC